MMKKIIMMKKIMKWFLIIMATIGVGFCLHVIILTILFSLGTNRPDGELRQEEVKLFDELKKELNLKKISRTPEYQISDPKKNEPYGLYFRYINCNVSKDSLNKLAKKIVLKVDKKIILSRKFSSIDLIFIHWDCIPGDISFHYSRKNIDDLKNKNE